MYLTKNDCDKILKTFVKESVGLLNEYSNLKEHYNFNDFNPNEKKMDDTYLRIKTLNKLIESIQIYIEQTFST